MIHVGDVTMEIYMIEKVTFSVYVKMDIFIQFWEKWVQYVKPLRPDFDYFI